MHARAIRRRGFAPVTLAGAAALVGGLGAGLAGPGAAGVAGAAVDYTASATVASDGPTVFEAPATDLAVENLTITEHVPGGVPTGYVCVTPSAGSFVATEAPHQTPVATATGGIAVANAAISGTSVSFQVTTASATSAGTITLSNLHVTTSTYGRSTVTVRDGLASACATSGGNTLSSTATAFALEEYTQDTYGQTPADTTAIEYGDQFACKGTSGTVAHTAVLATSAAPYDALSAASLEGQVPGGAGLLLSDPTSLPSATTTALHADGVSTVYVVGGSLAIAPSVVSALSSTPATRCVNGVATSTGSNITVVGPIAGATAEATAAAIVQEANSVAAFTSTQAALNLSAVTPSTYNDTTGNASATGEAAPAGRTAMLAAGTDFRDAMTASGIAYGAHLPILLTPSTGLGTDARKALVSLGIHQVVVLGGQLAVPPGIVNTLQALSITVVRIAGQDATDTAGMLARFEDAQGAGLGLGWVPTTAGSALLAQGASANDALGAAAISGAGRASIYLTEGPTKGLGTSTAAVLGDAGTAIGLGSTAKPAPIYDLQVLGGPLAVPHDQILAAAEALGGVPG